MVVRDPALWSLEKRNLYTIVTEVQAGGKIVDRSETRFGIRSLEFDPIGDFCSTGRQ